MAKKATKKRAKQTPREKLIALLNKPDQTFEELCNEMNLPPKGLRALLVELEKMGVRVTVDEHTDVHAIASEDRIGPQDLEFDNRLKNGVHRFGLLSDTHLGSHYQQLTYLKEFYARAVDMGVTVFYNSGDVWAGNGKVYRGQINEIFAHGLDHAVEYAAEHYPQYKGVVTRFITGNHDLSWWKSDGVDIGQAVQRVRPDMEYLGQAGAYDRVGEKARIYLHHPDGGGAYALSYNLQKIVEKMTPEQRPEIVSSGHLHQLTNFQIVGVDCYQPGCFEAQNTFLKRKGLHPSVGGWVVEVEMDKGEMRLINQTKIRWGTPIIKDF